MRLHRLTVTAFGPFAGTETVDFDRLTDAGLFLLHGPTGAGKTSVLDAVCFALYGRVPGARASAGRLRSDHAAEGIAPEVVCEFSVGTRRFEVTRSPEWQRPKRRGSGMTREPARAMLREFDGGEWQAVTNRADEAGELLQRVLGMGADQFTKLVLLPQGEFAAFLRASAEERRPMLQRLFGADRFADVERWLADRRRELSREVTSAQDETGRLAARAEEASAVLDVHGEAGALDARKPAEVADAVSRWAALAVTARDAAAVRVDATAAVAAQARAAREAADAADEQRRRRAKLSAELASLTARDGDQRDRLARLQRAAAAAAVVPLLAELDRAQARATAASAALAAAQATAAAAGENAQGATPGQLSERTVGLREEIGALAEVLPAAAELAGLEGELTATRQRLETAEAEAEAALAEAMALDEVTAALEAERVAAQLVAVTLGDRQRDAERRRTVLTAARERDALAAAAAGAAQRAREAVDAHHAATAIWLDLRTRRLDGMAAELAASLADGAPCPVCGSAEHPAPAAAGQGSVTPEQERAAEQAVRGTERGRATAEAEARDVATRLAAADAAAGGAEVSAAETAMREAEDAVAAARAAAHRCEDLAADAERGTEGARVARERAAAAGSRTAEAREALSVLTGRTESLRDRLEAARGEDPDVKGRHARLRRAVEALDRVLAALRDHGTAQQTVADGTAAARRAARAAGFAGPADAREAVLAEAERLRLETAVAQHDKALQRVRALLADPAIAGHEPAAVAGHEPADPAIAGPEPAEAAIGLDHALATEARAVSAERAARDRLTLCERATRSLDALATALRRQADETAPLLERYRVLDAVSRCVEGTGGDNTLRMRLSAFVVAARLEQVAAAASVRLLAMSGGRYTLVHTDEPARGGARSGLGLRVVDGWTGRQRETTSLSGGETFYASLALALGLADVVQAEAGGTAIETLLVDEGFGTLDVQTLDEVMDTLDGLRAGGRAVGLVSHVGDLRDRIPAQLEVVKTRTGSRLRQPELVG